jgi:transketolase
MSPKSSAKDLRRIAREIRITTFKAIANAGGGHFGGSLSICEILAVLYFQVMKIDPQRPDAADRDFFVLSKGHGGPALYATLALRGFFPVSKLRELDKPLSPFPKHVDRLKLAGIEASTGPLGQGLSLACGMAIALKQQARANRVYVLMGDGELDSGQVWEAAMTASKYGLDNLTALVDRNRCQVDGTTRDVMPTEPLADKFAAFGFRVFHADGHDTGSLLEAVRQSRRTRDKPSVVLARTVKGRGVSFMENRFQWHSGSVTPEEYARALADLEERR